MRMPSIFVGHGTPMNAISNNKYTEKWRDIGDLFKPKGIIMISAHWFTNQTLTQENEHPEKINDMYGFPDKLYEMDYSPNGSLTLSREIKESLGEEVKIDNSWGIDHGAWAVLVHMYPKADIPLVQLSVNGSKTPQEQFILGQKIAHLRDKGFMIIASGNIVHNLSMIRSQSEPAYPWAVLFDDYIEEAIVHRHYEKCIHYLDFGQVAKLSVPSPDHYYPLLTLLGSVNEDDQVTVFNKDYELSSLSMTSYIFN